MNISILNELSSKLYHLGKMINFPKSFVRSDRYSSEIYIINKHALQLEIDWQENNLFMYVVYLKNEELPYKSVIYIYNDGQWCRKFLEEVYKTKRPLIKNSNRRYSSEYLFDCFEFYMQLIDNNPAILTEFYKSMGCM